jgi:hypothetical protein
VTTRKRAVDFAEVVLISGGVFDFAEVEQGVSRLMLYINTFFSNLRNRAGGGFVTDTTQ